MTSERLRHLLLVNKKPVDSLADIQNISRQLYDLYNISWSKIKKFKVSNDFHIDTYTTHLRRSRCSSWWGGNVINQHPSYAYSSHAIYFLPHDRSYDFIFLILLSMLISTITYLHSNGILSDLHHPLRWHLLYCSYSFHTHSNLTQVFFTICSSYLMLTIGWLDTSLIPMYSDWMIVYLVITWTLTYLVLWLATYCVYKPLKLRNRMPVLSWSILPTVHCSPLR